MVIRFADVTVDAEGHEVQRAGRAIDVQPQVLDVLLYLIRHRDRVVPKEELLDAVWQHRFVTESALTSRIKSARKAIGDNGRDQQMIRTVHGRGYRFVATIDADPVGTERSPALVRRRLPAQTTPFVGREHELRRIAELFGNPDCQLLTIVAPGGMGKTRLALEAAERGATRYADGVYFAPFAGVSDPGQLVHAIATSIGLSLEARAEPDAQLLSFLATKELLLVLDNLEHLPKLELVADIVTAAPGVTVLATSRERLHLHAEWTFELAGMGSTAPDSDAESADDAVELFVQSARRARHDFAVDERSAGVVRRICRLVGGMPLALELAAGWCELLAVDEIAAEIEHGLGFLQTDLRDVPERHRSIESVFGATWARLAPDERDVFMKLSVFRGGFTRDAALAIAGAGLPLLRRLNNKSMIATTHDQRFAIHELVRQYGERQLERAGLTSEVRRRHSDYFLTWLTAQSAALRGGRQREAADEIAADIDNLRAAWSDAADGGRIEAIEQAIGSLWLYYDIRVSPEMGGFIRDALPVVESSDTDQLTRTALRGLLHAALGVVEAHRGAFDDGLALLQRGVALLGPCGEHPRHAWKLALAQFRLGWVSFLCARNAEAEADAKQALAIYSGLEDDWGIARCQYLLGNNRTAIGQLQPSLGPLRECRAIASRMGDRRMSGLACRNLAILAIWFGDYPEANALLDEAMASSEELGHWLGVAYSLREVGKVRVAEGRYGEAVAEFQRSIAITDELENRWESAATADDLGIAKAALGELDAAAQAITWSLDAATTNTNRYYVARCVGNLGALAFRRGDVRSAEQQLGDALGRWTEIGHEPYMAWVLLHLGRVASVDPGRQDEAERRYAESLELAIRHELAPIALDVLVSAAELDGPSSVDDRESLLRLAAVHPATTFEVRERARAMRSGAAGSDRTAGSTDLWETAERVAQHLARRVPG